MPVKFTQYLRPYGTPKRVEVDRSPGIEALAADLQAHGIKLECEVLMTDQVSFTAEYGDEVLAIELSPNGPEVLEAVDKLIQEAARRFRGLKNAQEEANSDKVE